MRTFTLKDRDALISFLCKLSSESIYFWNRFGTKRFTPQTAKEVAYKQAEISQKQEVGFVAYSGDELVGYCYLRFFPDKPQKKGTASLGMVVRDDFQNQGVGRKMMEHMIAYCRKHQRNKIWLSTYSDNERTLYFYKQFGFIAEGIFMFDEYFGKKPRHVVSMAKFLSPAAAKQALQLKKKYLS